MISRNTLILLVIFVVLVGAVFLIPQVQAKLPKTTPTPAATLQPVIPLGTVEQFTVQSKTGNSVTVKSAGSGKWLVVTPADLTYDPATVSTAAGFFQTAMVQATLPTQPPLSAMGLDAPEDTVTVQMADGSQKVIKIGKLTPTGGGYYVQVDGPPAFTVAKTDLDNLLSLLKSGTPPAPTGSPAAGTGTAAPAESVPSASPTFSSAGG